jgi:hypothetical protein
MPILFSDNELFKYYYTLVKNRSFYVLTPPPHFEKCFFALNSAALYEATLKYKSTVGACS